MIEAEYHTDGCYIIRMSTPDRSQCAAIAVGFSIPPEAAMVAIINRGIDSLMVQLQREADKVTAKRLAENTDKGGDE